MSSLRCWRTTLVRRGRKIGRRDRTCTCMGFRPRVSETRVYTLHHSPKNLVRPERLARSRAEAAQRFLRPPGLLLFASPPKGRPLGSPFALLRASPSPRFALRPRTAAKLVAAAGLAPAQAFAQRVLRPSCFLISPRRDKVVRTEGVAPSRACAHRILAPARILFRHIRKNWSIHRDVRPAVCLTKTVRRFLRVGCMVETEGLAPS
jgi:hypothetical protein